MKGLRKYLTPFAPDQSGAVSVLYELGGMLVICDAGGCTGNVCGFDEPRWFETRSAVFSAGLRDMDAIRGRDDRLVAQLADAAEKLDVTFAAVIGTPVPAVIGTDYRALERMLSKKTDLSVLTVNTDGMELYDKGEEKAYLALFEKFSDKNEESEDMNDKDRPYEIAYPLASELVPEVNYQGKKTLIVQQQVIANAVRKEIEKRTGEKEAITTATWFMRKEEILTDLNVDAADDISLKEEDDFISLVEKEGYDVIFADPCMERMIPGFEGTFIPLTHFAVSGKLNV